MEEEKSITSSIQLVIVTPEAKVLDTTVRFVALPLFDGEIGIGSNHSPMVGRLGYGELRFVSGEQKCQRYYIGGGFVEVANNLVSVLTNRALPATELDIDVAKEQLQEVLKRPAAGDEELAIRQQLSTQARAQIRVAERAR
ncbi:MAG: ATP synthase F1 subunit epsilon [Pirellulales bacterium]|nr:ATP synthase F1 subunit epsilon [Pirellulales bacterium]